MKVFTIGFTKKSAEEFFGALKSSGAARLVDVRLNNISQLAGFAKKDDLEFFLRKLCGMEYEHRLELAPTQELLDQYRKEKLPGKEFDARFRKLIASRKVEKTIPRASIDNAVLLCSEADPAFCHRRVAAEYLRDKWGNLDITHLP
jgi:uncharacterized protein (DUF488 family)